MPKSKGASASVATPILPFKIAPAEPYDFSEMQKVEFDAALTRKDVEESERNYNTTWGVSRRMTLMFLTSSRTELLERFGKDDGPDILLDTVNQINEYKHLQCLIDLADSAEARLLCVVSMCLEGKEEASHG